MNPVFIFLVLLGTLILWFLSSFVFFPLGRLLYRIWKDTIDEMNREEDKEEKEND